MAISFVAYFYKCTLTVITSGNSSKTVVTIYIFRKTSLTRSFWYVYSNYQIQHTAIFSVVIHITASRDAILRRSPDVECTSDSRTQLRDVIWIKYISTTTEEM